MSLLGKRRSDVDRERGFADATLLVEHGDDHEKPFAEICVSVSP